MAETQDVALSAAEQYEESPEGSVAYVYFRLHNRGSQRVACTVEAHVQCAPSGERVPVVLNVAPEDIGSSTSVSSAVPYFAQAVCAPNDRIEAVEATLGLEILPDASPASPRDRAGRTPPPPPGYGLPPLGRQVRHAHPGDPNSVGWLVQLDYGLSGYWVPTRSTVINSDGATGFASQRRAGGLGPRLGLTYWPYLSRHFAAGLGGLVEGGAMGLANGYTDATTARVDVLFEGGDRQLVSGLAKAGYGYRYAESHAGNAFDLGHADASIGAGFVRVDALARMCTHRTRTLPFCRMGFDVGVAFEMPNYARAAAGGLLLQGDFWMRRTLAVHVEGGWSYPVGGRSIFGANDDGRGGTFSAAFVFNDDFFNVYPRRGDARE